MDEILGYLLDDLDALEACSLTCRHFSVRHDLRLNLIHQRRLCLATRPEPKGSQRSHRRTGPKVFERLVDPDRSGLLCYTRYLTLRMKDGSFNPTGVQDYLPHLRSNINRMFLPSTPFVSIRSSRFSMNILACSPTLYDISTYGTPTE